MISVPNTELNKAKLDIYQQRMKEVCVESGHAVEEALRGLRK